MKLHVEESSDFAEVDITVKCPFVDSELAQLLEQIRLYGFALKCKKEEDTYLVKPMDVFYVESVDDKTFVYCKDEIYRSELRLYTMEEKLPANLFVRVKKSCILNLGYIDHFKSSLNGKVEACLANGERIEIARHYVNELKARLKEMEGA